MPMSRIIQIFVSGREKPGATARLTKAIAEANGRLLDIEQVVTGSLLSLSLLIEIQEEGERLVRDLTLLAKSEGLSLDARTVEPDSLAGTRPIPTKQRYLVTCLGPEVPMPLVARLSALLSEKGAKIDRIAQIGRKKISCIELTVSASGLDQQSLAKSLLALSREFSVDVALQEENVFRKSKRLLVMDMDSTLVAGEGIDALAAEAKVGPRVAEITARAMNGEISFPDALRERVRLLAGLPVAAMESVRWRIGYTPGAQDLIRAVKRLGFKTAVLSGGFDYFTDRVKEELGLDYAYSNRLEVADGRLTGRLAGEIIDGKRKAELLEEIAAKEGILLDQVVAVGDGANDLPMLSRAGLGIAFNAKPKVREEARASITQTNLAAILFLLGIGDEELARLNNPAT